MEKACFCLLLDNSVLLLRYRPLELYSRL
jgi:hypothetical protein